MQKLALLIIIALFLNIKLSIGCSCASPPSFCESITNSTGDIITDVVLRAKFSILEDGERKLKVSHVLYGQLERSEIDIQSSFLCDLFSYQLENNKEYIFALMKGREHLNPLQSNEYFAPISCSIFFLEIENEILKGKIALGVETLPYREISALASCGNSFSIFSLEEDLWAPLLTTQIQQAAS